MLPDYIRMRAATIAIQYESPRLAVTGYIKDDAGFATQLERALARSNAIGKVIELKPPRTQVRDALRRYLSKAHDPGRVEP
jgi:hypothetical protein